MTASLQQEFGQILMLATRDFQNRLAQDLATRGISGVNSRQRNVILHLGQFGASRSVDLAEAAGIRPQSMMKVVHELEQMGMVERRADPSDSRAKLIDFTARGRRFIKQLSASTETVWQQYRQQIDHKQLQQAFSTLKHLTEFATGSNSDAE
jgi:DNA-binding MarR family transcriptional regulator